MKSERLKAKFRKACARKERLLGCGGFTLVEAAAAWVVFMIFLLAFGKGVSLAAQFAADARTLRDGCQTAYGAAVTGQPPDDTKEQEVIFEMGDVVGTVQIRLEEYDVINPEENGEPAREFSVQKAVMDWEDGT